MSESLHRGMGNARVCQEKSPLFIAQHERRRKQQEGLWLLGSNFMGFKLTYDQEEKTLLWARLLASNTHAIYRFGRSGWFAAALIDPFYTHVQNVLLLWYKKFVSCILRLWYIFRVYYPIHFFLYIDDIESENNHV